MVWEERAIVIFSSSSWFFIQNNSKDHKASSAVRSSRDMAHLRVSSAILSNSVISDESNSISSIAASWMAAFFYGFGHDRDCLLLGDKDC